jgi:cardiolipin synthase
VFMKIPERRYIYKEGHYIQLLRSGDSYFSAVEKVIDEARDFIHFHTYILDEDETGQRIVDALIRAAKRGVRTYLLLDAFGTKYLSGTLIKSIENSGILFRFFSPTFITKGFYLSLRLHSKVVLADGETAILGGMNIANRYHGLPEKKEWLDYAILFKGPECVHLLNILQKLWNKRFIPGNERSREIIKDVVSWNENVKLIVLQNNWYRNKIEILKSYRYAFRDAREKMIIFASYFLPGRNERRLMRNASARGVDITVVFSAESDAPIFKRATRFLYDFILKNNIRIYEYLPSNLHAKVATVDGKWATIGSYNLNHLSDYASIEINVGILNEEFTSKFERELTGIIQNDCREVTFDEFNRKRNWITRLAGWASYQMIRLMMRIMFQMTSKKNHSHSV